MPLRFKPRWRVFGSIQEFHSISTLPVSHYKYNEWLQRVEIGIWALKWSSQCVLSHGWGKVGLACIPIFKPPLSGFGQIWAIHSISTLPMSHCKYDEWFCKVEIWIHHAQPSPLPGFWVVGGDKIGSRVPYFSHQDGVCLDWFKNITASQPFQHLSWSIINGWRWLRLLYEV